MNGLKGIILIFLVLVYSCGHKNADKLTREEVLKKGAKLYTAYGCNVCHSLDGSTVYGPPLNNIYMKEITIIREGRERNLKADRKYLLRAVTNPSYEKDVKYRNKEMPPTSVSKEEAQLLVDYLILLEM